ncbi:helix-turn-helix domain-containing protein [Cellulophaga sp. BC115SP]|uniref:helix-turn-helix domain-containing protein n=1 Tax=Cellulophaga sp. BC115SP TaxID=2683263 RepID=UPI00351B41DF
MYSFAHIISSNRLNELRTRLNCSQKELSEKLGLMLRTIQRIENNELKPSFYSLKVIGMT